MNSDLNGNISKCPGESLPSLPICEKREMCKRYLAPERSPQSWIVMPNYLTETCEYFFDKDKVSA